MQLLTIIQCHRTSEVLRYTVNKLSSCASDFVLIHVDLKSDVEMFRHLERDNVKLLKNRVNVSWGAVSQFEATFNLLKESLLFEYDYVSLISGDDVFLQPVSKFKEFLEAFSGLEFIGISKNNEVYVTPDDRHEYLYPSFFYLRNKTVKQSFQVKIFKILFRLGCFHNPKLKPFSRFYKGCNWFTITRNAAAKIVEEWEGNSRLRGYFGSSYCCDEVVPHTMLMNSGYESSINFRHDDDNLNSLRYIDWVSGPEYPRNLSIDDLMIDFHTDVFFARKVSDSVSYRDLVRVLGD